jgi:protein-S-isoprenylcysteine O-methyltransferase Ste14
LWLGGFVVDFPDKGDRMNNAQTSQAELLKVVLSRFVMALLALFLLFFLPAGTFAYWQAWVYMAIIFIPMLFVLLYLLKNDPELLARRMKLNEKHAEQRLIVKLSVIPFLISFLLPGFDIRFGWSHVPAGVAIIADILVLLGYGIIFLVFRENRYASRVVEVEQGQTVISSGPYALVRHPMYLGSILLYVMSPLALGSWWAIIPAVFIIPVLVARALNEESVLAKELDGYRDYMQKTRYRLIPGIW